MHTPEHVYSGGLAPPGRSEGHEKQSGTQSEMSSVLHPKAPRRQQGRRAEKGTPVPRQHFTTCEVPAAPEGETPGVCAPRLTPTRLPRLPRPVGTETSGALSGGPGGGRLLTAGPRARTQAVPSARSLCGPRAAPPSSLSCLLLLCLQGFLPKHVLKPPTGLSLQL